MTSEQLLLYIKPYSRPEPMGLIHGLSLIPQAILVRVGVGDIVIADGRLCIIVDTGKIDGTEQYGSVTNTATVADAATGCVCPEIFFGNELYAVDTCQIIENKFSTNNSA